MPRRAAGVIPAGTSPAARGQPAGSPPPAPTALPPPSLGLGRPILVALVLAIMVAGVLEHLAAGLGAITARPGAALHVLVRGMLRAGLAAPITGPGTRRAGKLVQRPPTGHDLGGQGTELR